MHIIRQWAQRCKPPVALLGGAALGLLLGLLVAWVIWPVEYYNATPGHLRSDFREDYVLWVADQYARDGDQEQARARLGVEYWKAGELAEVLEELVRERSDSEASRVRDLVAAVGSEPSPEQEMGGKPGLGGFSVREAVLVVVACAAGVVFVFGRSQLIRRVTFLVILLPALVFFIALAIALGQAGGLAALVETVPAALDYTMDYLANLTRGDLGVIASPYPSAPATPVTAELARAFPRSLGLLAVALALAVLVGLPLGIGAGLRRKTRFSGILVFFSVLGISTPSYFAAMLLIWFGVWLYRTTGMDFLPLHGFGWDAHLILPAIVLAARPAANVMRLGYNALVEVLDADFVRTAHAKGLGPWIVFFRHVLRNAGVPLLTTVAVSLRFSLAILPIVEYIFNWSGVGEELLTAIQVQDTTAVIGMILPLAVLFVLVNLLLEALYRIIDPRLRVKEAAAA
jgi:ABC-type dipeptide/oligopeptide/nickel transport system permease component